MFEIPKLIFAPPAWNFRKWMRSLERPLFSRPTSAGVTNGSELTIQSRHLNGSVDSLAITLSCYTPH